MDRERNRWLHQEIAHWQEEGILDEATGAVLRGRYPVASPSGVTWGLLVFSVLGGLLVGLGVISLFAANWEWLGREARAVVSLLPLAACGVAGVMGMRRAWKRLAFWEGLGVAWMLSLVAGVCLVLQTYQVGGELSKLAMLLALLSLPIVWITRSTMAMVFWLSYPPVWYFLAREEGGWRGVHASFPWESVVALALLALSLPAFLACRRHSQEGGMGRTGFFLTGGAYPALVLLFLSEIFFHFLFWGKGSSLILCTWLCAAGFWWVGEKRKIPYWPAWGRSYAVLAGLFAPFHEISETGEGGILLVMSLALAAWLVRWGIRTLQLRVFNEGFFLAFWIILVKFFSSEISLTWKGILFLFFGLCLLGANVGFLTYRKRRSLHEENA